MSATPVVYARSEIVTIRPAISLAGRPLYPHTIETIGMLVAGKMSAGIDAAANAPSSTMMIAMQVTVYGRRSASLTIHIGQSRGAVEVTNAPGTQRRSVGI